MPQVQVQHEPAVAPAPISQHALEPLDNDGTNDDNTPAVAELAEVGELNAQVAAGQLSRHRSSECWRPNNWTAATGPPPHNNNNNTNNK